MKKNRKKSLYCLVLLSAALTACGSPDGSASEALPQTQAAGERGVRDWKTEEWQYSSEVSTDGEYYVGKYISGLEYSPEQEYDSRSSEYRCLGANFYSLDSFSVPAGESWQFFYYLNGYEDAADEIWHRRVELPELSDQEGAECHIASFDIQDTREYVLFAQIFKDGETQAYLAMHYSFDGELLSMTDLFPAMQDNGMVPEGRTLYTSIHVDGQGRCFLCPLYEADRIVVLGTDGKCLAEITGNQEEIRFSFLMKTPEGEPVFQSSDHYSGQMQLTMYDPATDEGKTFPANLPYARLMGITEDGILYYEKQGQLERWDLFTGNRNICFDFEKLGIGKNTLQACIGIDANGIPLLLDHSRGRALICKLASEPGQEGDPIRLISLVKDSSFLSSSAILFSQEQGAHPILVEQPEGNLEAFRSRAMAELTAGKGGELYYVSGEDMRTLYEKGVLADLSGVLDEDLRKSLYEGALSCGVIDGVQAGLAPQAYVTTLLISDELWSGEGWTLEEALTLPDTHPELEQIMTGSAYTAKTQALRLLLLQDLPNSPFLDMDAGVCDFDNPLFVKALETAGQTANGTDKGAELVRSGKAAAFLVNMESFPDFSAELSDLGEGYHPVGFPTGTGSGSYWNADYFLVVNAQAQHRDFIDAYLASLFSRERQRELPRPVRNDLVDMRVQYFEDHLISPWSYSMGGGNYIPLTTKPDGSPWTEEYKDILGRAMPRPQNTWYIEQIILEEAGGCLSGVKTPEQVAETIQNRVQLYLDERQ